jgi:D-alanyl-D-alanine carboxypeptidase (penicillin-binding protein 5/6)
VRRALAAALVTLLAAAAPAAGQDEPEVSARAAFLFQPDTRDVIYAKRAREERPVASATKLMTALVSLDELDLRKRYTVPAYQAAAGESLAGLRGGQRMTFSDLLRGLMLPSGNDAASALAQISAGSVSAFVEQMNERADELGLRNSHFTTPVGLDQPGNYSSAEDLVKMALLLRRNSFAKEIMAQPRAVLRSATPPITVTNRNTLVGRYPFVDGVKTGHTLDAGYVLVGSATRSGINVVSAVLGAPSEAARDADTLELLRYGLDRYTRKRAVRARHVLGQAEVTDQDTKVGLVAKETLAVVARTDEKLEVRVTGAPKEVEGPLPAGERVGTVEVLRRGEVVARTALVLGAAVPEASVTERVRAWAGRPGTLLLLAFLAGCTVLLVLLRRRLVRRRGRGESQSQ